MYVAWVFQYKRLNPQHIDLHSNSPIHAEAKARTTMVGNDETSDINHTSIDPLRQITNLVDDHASNTDSTDDAHTRVQRVQLCCLCFFCITVTLTVLSLIFYNSAFINGHIR